MTFRVEQGFSETERATAAALFWQAFSAKLHKVMGPEKKGLAFIELVINPQFALVARDNSNQMLGLAGFKTKDGGLVEGSLSDMAKIYGWFGGTWRGLVLSVLERDLQPGVFQMDGIFVAAKARGQGVGTALLSAIKDEARKSGMSEVQLDVIDTNPRAKALYEREGFSAVSNEETGPFQFLFGFNSATRMSWAVTAP